LDPAIRRRFEKRIYIPLPEDSSRFDILKSNMSNVESLMSEEDWKFVVSKTKLFEPFLD
jgi:vacuolar protein-sorting-associated protein 4